jgi:hypothetical protein
MMVLHRLPFQLPFNREDITNNHTTIMTELINMRNAVFLTRLLSSVTTAIGDNNAVNIIPTNRVIHTMPIKSFIALAPTFLGSQSYGRPLEWSFV